jgi:predicted outer membrane repeat protein
MRLACAKPAGGGGGGAASDAGLCRVLDRLEVAAAAALVLVGLLFKGLSGGGDHSYGGAVSLHDSSGAAVTVSGCTFRENDAGNDGGAISAGRGTTLTVTACLFDANHAGFGGAIYFQSATGLAITASTFTANTASMSDDYAAMYWTSHEVCGEYIDAYSNEAANAAFGGGGTSGGGGVCTQTAGGMAPAVPWAAASDGTDVAICLGDDATAAVGTPCGHSGCSPTITINNPGEMRLACAKPAGGSGGAASDAGLCRVLDRLEVAAAAALVLVGLLFEELTGGRNGGAVYLSSSGAAVTVSGCTFRGNDAGYGGAIEADDGTTLTVTACLFDTNHAPRTFGGAVFFGGATLAITASTFTANTASDDDHAAVVWGGHQDGPVGYTNEEANAAFGPCQHGQQGDDSCRYASDGECDVPQYCAVNTDATDCGAAGGGRSAAVAEPRCECLKWGVVAECGCLIEANH